MGQNRQNSRESGFTLVEVAIVMLILGVLLAGASAFFISQIKAANYNETQTKLEAIDLALQAYLDRNGHYPCVAANDAAPETATYGIAVGGDDCTVAPLAGTSQAGSVRDAAIAAADGITLPGTHNVRVGSIPTRTLNIPDDYANDGWGNRFTYAITEVLASDGQYDRDHGGVSVDDSGGNSVVQPDDSAHYIIISHGETGAGSVSRNGGTRLDCPAAGASLDEENCNDDAVFIETTLASDTGATFYDDVVLRTVSDFVSIPAGAVIAFNSARCPAGWGPYDPAIGRSIIGTSMSGMDYDEGGVITSFALGATGGTQDQTLRIEEMPESTLGCNWIGPIKPVNSPPIEYQALAVAAGGTAQQVVVPNAVPSLTENFDNRSPYIALRYCEKL